MGHNYLNFFNFIIIIIILNIINNFLVLLKYIYKILYYILYLKFHFISFDDSYFDGDALVLGVWARNPEKCKEQSEEYDHSFKRESAYLVIHSVLHLLGYDHMNEDDKKKMRKREEELLEALNIPRE